MEDSRLLLWEARCERGEAGRAGSKGFNLGGREGVGSKLEGGRERTLVTTRTNRSRTHKLKSVAKLEDEADGERSRLLITKINDITENGVELGTDRIGTPPGRGGVGGMGDSNILIAVSGNRIDIVGDGRSVATRGPDDHLSRRVVGHGAGVGRKLSSSEIVNVTIPGEIEGVVGNTGGGGHDLGTDLNRTRLNTEAIIHHTSIEDTTRGRSNKRGPGVTRENIAKGEGRRNTLDASTNRERKIDVLSKRHSTGLGVVHLDGTVAGSITALGVGAAVRAAVRATTVAGVHQDFN